MRKMAIFDTRKAEGNNIRMKMDENRWNEDGKEVIVTELGPKAASHGGGEGEIGAGREHGGEHRVMPRTAESPYSTPGTETPLC